MNLRLITSQPSVRDALADPSDISRLLTPMEVACLRLVAQHLSSREIAARLGIAKTSVDTYCNRARAKLKVDDRFAAARLLGESEAAPRTDPAQSGAGQPQALQALARSRIGFRLAAALGLVLAAAMGLGALLFGFDALEDLRPARWDRSHASSPSWWSRLTRPPPPHG